MGNFTMGSGKEFSPLPEDKYTVEVLSAEIYTGTKFQSTEEEQRLKVTFVVLDEDKKMIEEGVEVPIRGRRLWSRTGTKFSPPGSNKVSNITKMVQAIYGHELEQAEVETFDEQDLVGKQLCVMVDAKKAPDGRVWNNVISFSKVVKELPKYDELDAKEQFKTSKVKKSQAVSTDTSEFEKEMDQLAESKAKK